MLENEVSHWRYYSSICSKSTPNSIVNEMITSDLDYLTRNTEIELKSPLVFFPGKRVLNPYNIFEEIDLNVAWRMNDFRYRGMENTYFELEFLIQALILFNDLVKSFRVMFNILRMSGGFFKDSDYRGKNRFVVNFVNKATRSNREHYRIVDDAHEWRYRFYKVKERDHHFVRGLKRQPRRMELDVWNWWSHWGRIPPSSRPLEDRSERYSLPIESRDFDRAMNAMEGNIKSHIMPIKFNRKEAYRIRLMRLDTSRHEGEEGLNDPYGDSELRSFFDMLSFRANVLLSLDEKREWDDSPREKAMIRLQEGSSPIGRTLKIMNSLDIRIDNILFHLNRITPLLREDYTLQHGKMLLRDESKRNDVSFLSRSNFNSLYREINSIYLDIEKVNRPLREYMILLMDSLLCRSIWSFIQDSLHCYQGYMDRQKDLLEL